jgi:hypothetical protein
MRPDVDDLVVAFAGVMTPLRYCFSTSAILLLRVVNLLVAFLGHNHVVDADGHAGLGRLAEAELLELVEHDDGLFVAGKLVAFPDQVAELGLLDREVDEPSSGGQISLKITRPTVVSMIFLSLLPKPVACRSRGSPDAMRSCVFNAPSS